MASETSVAEMLREIGRILYQPRPRKESLSIAQDMLQTALRNSLDAGMMSNAAYRYLGKRVALGSRPALLYVYRQLSSRFAHRLRYDTIRYGLARPSIPDHRLRALEQEVRDLRQGLATIVAHPSEEEEPERKEEEKVVTLESLKGKDILFVIMPFKEEFDDVWNGGIKRAAAGTGLEPVRIDMITESSEVTDDIVAAIRQAKIVVVDVTNNNPNVMFEAGYALALKKKHIIIGQSVDFLTFDIQNIRTLPYKNTWKGIEQLHLDLQNFIKGTLGPKAQQKTKPTKSKVSI